MISHQPVQEIRKPIASLHFYYDIFVTEFNIFFGYPRSDTCNTCDSIMTKMEDTNATSEEVEKWKQELEAHKTLAQRRYQAFQYDQELSWQKVSRDN